MKLKDLLEGFEYEVAQWDEEIEVNEICNDSRKIKEGDVFVCIEGAGFEDINLFRMSAKKARRRSLFPKTLKRRKA